MVSYLCSTFMFFSSCSIAFVLLCNAAIYSASIVVFSEGRRLSKVSFIALFALRTPSRLFVCYESQRDFYLCWDRWLRTSIQIPTRVDLDSLRCASRECSATNKFEEESRHQDSLQRLVASPLMLSQTSSSSSSSRSSSNIFFVFHFVLSSSDNVGQTDTPDRSGNCTEMPDRDSLLPAIEGEVAGDPRSFVLSLPTFSPRVFLQFLLPSVSRERLSSLPRNNGSAKYKLSLMSLGQWSKDSGVTGVTSRMVSWEMELNAVLRFYIWSCLFSDISAPLKTV